MKQQERGQERDVRDQDPGRQQIESGEAYEAYRQRVPRIEGEVPLAGRPDRLVDVAVHRDVSVPASVPSRPAVEPEVRRKSPPGATARRREARIGIEREDGEAQVGE